LIKVFSPTDKEYASNGDVVVIPTKARVKNADNGAYYLELVCSIDYNEYIQANNIITAPTPQGEQAFRIADITKNKNRLTVKAWHVFYDANNLLVADSYAQDMTCAEAMAHFNAATDTTSPFTVSSDITSINTYRCVRKSLTECINTVIERWGGHLVRNNWNISILNEIGRDNGVTIEYKKNLSNLTAEYNWENVVTKLLPVGKDGLLLDEVYVYSDTQYSIPFTKTVSFSQDINEDDYETTEAYTAALKADLATQAQEYVNKYCLPSVNYNLKGNPEKVTDIGDIIEVRDARIGVDILTSVISYEYDAITNKYVNLEFGNFSKSLNELISNIERNTESQVGQAASTKQNKLTAGDNITIRNDVISAQTTTYTAGYGIDITDNVVSVETINGELEIVNNGHLGVIGFKNNNGLSFAVPLPKLWDSGVVELTDLSLTIYKDYAGTTVVTDDIVTNGTIKTGYVVIASKINETTLLINVSDTGSGIVSSLTSGAYIIDLTSLAIQLELTP
jgi:phage minor structural protein